ncbi:MAG: A/G-specific adenine glycosylase [Bacteroidales bacterium]|nr:A/G-specific adenine glycosylase [Bacteroidales bacterium]
MTSFTTNILTWYQSNQRDLPWRFNKHPYQIWISEIILQQTQVKQGLPYYRRFMEAFPDVLTLAAAPEQEVLKLWQGLGYYSRARNLHAAANDVVERLNGQMPDTKKGLQQLKGIGPYTAAAIASIAFDEPVAVVDGNVYRLLSRYYAIGRPIDSTEGRKHFETLAHQLLPKDRPGDFNQAMMDMGAMVCTPAQPKCHACPLAADCQAQALNQQSNFPVKSKQVKKRDRFFNYLIIEKDQHYLINERRHKDIWKGLYEFPLVETEKEWTAIDLSDLFISMYQETTDIEWLASTKHLLTHQTIYIRFFKVQHKATLTTKIVPDTARFVGSANLLHLPVPKPIEKAIKQYIIISPK